MRSLMADLRWDSLAVKRTHGLILLYKMIANLAPSYLFNLVLSLTARNSDNILLLMLELNSMLLHFFWQENVTVQLSIIRYQKFSCYNYFQEEASIPFLKHLTSTQVVDDARNCIVSTSRL